MRRIASLLLAGVLLASTASCGGDDDAGGSNGPDRALFQPSGVVGPDSFAPTFELTSYQVTDASTLTDGKVKGNAPGLYAGRTYGGSGKNICDVEAMIRFLTYYKDRGRAWAAVQGIAYEELPNYLRSLTPVYALQNLNVKMFGFKNGQSYGYDAVIAAGTAILIDDQGMPRARCACGNPLLGPKEEQPTPFSQDSVPEIPGDTTGDDGGDEGSDDPGNPDQPDDPNQPDQPDDPNQPDQPGEPNQPACPEFDSEFGWTDYIDPSGQRWSFLLADGQWHNLDDPAAPPVMFPPALPGFLDNCVEIRIIVNCPSPNGNADMTYYRDPDGNVWRYDAAEFIWRNTDVEGQAVAGVIDLPGYVENCLAPTDGQPSCPTPVGLGWTVFQSTTGEVWKHEDLGDGTSRWLNVDTGESVPTKEEIPGYLRDCGGPIECPPSTATIGTQYIDAGGHLWELVEQPEDYPAWDDLTTPDNEGVSPEDFYNENCDSYTFQSPPPNLCPPTYAVPGAIWIDSLGNAWTWNSHTGGAYGWDNLATDEIELLNTAELPNVPLDCQYPERQPDCPPIVATEGATYVGSNGHTYVYSEGISSWIDATDGTAAPIAYTAMLPGYQDDCLPPCPPENISTSEPGTWVDPSTGEIWVRQVATGRWVNTTSGTSVSLTSDLPFWEEWCLPPCAPTDQGPTNSYAFEGDQPVTDPAAAASYGDLDDKAVTVEPSPDGPTIDPIADERVQSSGATSDACNQYGCVEGEPQLGWSFTDSDGVRWWYTLSGRFTDESGRTVTFITDIAGYDELCNPMGETPTDAPCPPEVKSDPYIDSNGLDWWWLGSNNTEAESDHGRNWYHRYSDGSSAYKATIELETWFADCPPPTDPTIEINPGSLSVGLSAHTQMCVGETIDLRVFVTPTPDAAVNDVGISVNGESIELTDVGGNTWTGTYQATAAGQLTVVAGAADTSGATDSYTTVILVTDCGEPTTDPTDSTPTPTTEGPNRAPTITMSTRDECVEIESSDPAPVNIRVSVSDLDGDDLQVEVLASADTGPIERTTYEVTGSDRQTVTITLDYSYRGKTITIEGTVTDGELSDSDSLTVRGEYPGGCSSPGTPTTSSSGTAAPTTAASSNQMPTLVFLGTTSNPGQMPACLLSGAQKTPVRFRVDDPEGASVAIQARVAGLLAAGGVSPNIATSGQTITVYLSSSDAGKQFSVTGSDFTNITAAYTATITSTICA